MLDGVVSTGLGQRIEGAPPQCGDWEKRAEGWWLHNDCTDPIDRVDDSGERRSIIESRGVL